MKIREKMVDFSSFLPYSLYMEIFEIQQIIKTYQQQDYTGYKPREFETTFLAKRATVITGSRRVGKTSYMRNQIQELLKQETPIERICYLDFSHPAFIDNQPSPTQIEMAYYSLYPGNSDCEVFFFFDEIQMLPNWDTWVPHLLDMRKCRVMITGSSSHALSAHINTMLRGRSMRWELFPLSFREYLMFAGKEVPSSPVFSSKEQEYYANSFADYLEKGGLPELIDIIDERLRLNYLLDFAELVCLRDIIDLYNILSPAALRALTRKLQRSNTCPQTFSNLHHSLKSAGYKITYEQVSDYLSYLEDTYFAFSVPIFGSEKAMTRNPRKYYLLDPALGNCYPSPSSNIGTNLENLVFLHLRRATKTIYYYRDDKDLEVDFIVQTASGSLQLFQIAYEISNQVTFEREINGLRSAMARTNTRTGTLITFWEKKILDYPEGRIEVIPAWEFFLKR